MSAKKIKIILADDHALIREALETMLRHDESIVVASQAENGKKLLELIKQSPPDIVLLDIEMPVMGGMQALEIINKRFPDVAVIVLSFHKEIELMASMIAKGAKAFLTKDCNCKALLEAIHSVYNDGFYFNKSVSHALLEGYLKEKAINPIFSELALSKREVEILTELCEGKTNKQIASKLSIAASTVDFHRGRIYRKTKSKNLAGIVKYALKHGLINA